MDLVIRYQNSEETDTVTLPTHLNWKTVGKIRRKLKGKLVVENGVNRLEVENGMDVLENVKTSLVKELLIPRKDELGREVGMITSEVVDKLFNHYYPQIEGTLSKKKDEE